VKCIFPHPNTKHQYVKERDAQEEKAPEMTGNQVSWCFCGSVLKKGMLLLRINQATLTLPLAQCGFVQVPFSFSYFPYCSFSAFTKRRQKDLFKEGINSITGWI
jgi:hypothetical protein